MTLKNNTLNKKSYDITTYPLYSLLIDIITEILINTLLNYLGISPNSPLGLRLQILLTPPIRYFIKWLVRNFFLFNENTYF
ncbi:MAG: hypothetical protein HFI72_02410 [Peptococcaceae bacterium]|nr:hypothetical protein [Peptococcaceae bacterium]